MSALTADAMASIVFKKSLGIPSTALTNQTFQEPSRPGFPSVFQKQMYSEAIPDVAPADLAGVTTDDSGASITGSIKGKTSATSTMIRKYVKLALTEVVGSNGMAYESPDDATYGRVLQDCVPYNYDSAGSYLVTIYKSDGSTVVSFGSGSWVLDTAAGVLTFYDTISGVSAAAPPKITFYRYIGSKGASTAEQTAQAIEAQSLTFTEPIVFKGGSTSLVDDALTAVQLDDRDMSTLSSASPAMALQIGGDYDQSWRICVYGSSGATCSRFSIETRVSNVWVAKSSFMAL